MRFAVLGDIYLNDGVGLPDRQNIFSAVQEAVGPETALVGNVECALTERKSHFPYKWASLCVKPTAVEALRALSVATIANNHAGDAGPSGLRDTADALRAAGIGTVGYGDDLEASLEPFVLERPDGRIAFIALCCLTTNPLCLATPADPGIAPLSVQTLRRGIQNAKRKAETVVVLLHWGCEQTHYPVPDQIRLGRLAVEAGADAVVGCHAHVIQSYELYKGRWIFHGIGNFFFDAVNASLFRDGQFISTVPIEHAIRNRESLVPTFELRDGKLTLASLVLTRWQEGGAPGVYDLSEAAIRLDRINARLGAWIFRHPFKAASKAEMRLRCRLHNGFPSYDYSDLPIHGNWDVRALAAGAVRRAGRALVGLRGNRAGI
jgi:hypothetical protein